MTPGPRRAPGRRSTAVPVVVAGLVLTVALTALTALVACTTPGRGGDSKQTTTTSRPGRVTPTASGTAVFGSAPAGAAGLPPDTALGAAVRSRYVSFDADPLPAGPDGTVLTLDFFDDATFTARVTAVDRQSVFTSWSGPIDGMPNSLFVITRTADRYQVTASTTRGSFTMSLTAAGYYQVAQVEQPDVVDSGAVVPSP